MRGHRGPIRCLAIDDTGKLIVTACSAGEIRFWRARDGAFLAKLDIDSLISLRLARCNVAQSEQSSVATESVDYLIIGLSDDGALLLGKVRFTDGSKIDM